MWITKEQLNYMKGCGSDLDEVRALSLSSSFTQWPRVVLHPKNRLRAPDDIIKETSVRIKWFNPCSSQQRAELCVCLGLSSPDNMWNVWIVLVLASCVTEQLSQEWMCLCFGAGFWFSLYMEVRHLVLILLGAWETEGEMKNTYSRHPKRRIPDFLHKVWKRRSMHFLKNASIPFPGEPESCRHESHPFRGRGKKCLNKWEQMNISPCLRFMPRMRKW